MLISFSTVKQRIATTTHHILDSGRWALSALKLRERKEERAVEFVLQSSVKGDPSSVLRALDRFAENDSFLMNLGPDKLEMLDNVFAQHSPTQALELGGYLGYSAIAIASRLPRNGALVSVEKSPRLAALAAILIEHAGLTSNVRFEVGDLGTRIGALREPFNLILLDHAKDAYLKDLRLLEGAALISSNAVIFADNTALLPEMMEQYLQYVRDSRRSVTSEEIRCHMEYRPEVPDAVEITVWR